MTWTYTNNPQGSTLDAVRLLIGDVLVDDPQLTDEEISFYLAINNDALTAAIDAVRGLLALTARMVDQSVGELRYSYKQRAENYEKLLNSLIEKNEKKSTLSGASMQGIGEPFAGGISYSVDGDQESNTDNKPARFTRGMFDGES